jgi:phage/plasmid-like protein (TIGR03299 family)
MIATTVRVVCQNTLNLALQSAGSEGLAIRHHASLHQRVAEARQKLGLIAARFDAFDEELHAMLERQVDSAALGGYFDGLVPAAVTEREQHNRRRVIGAMESNFTNDTNTLRGMRGSVWAAYNAVSEWADHQRQFRGKSTTARAENRLASVWFGASHQLKQRAYASALELARQN